MGSPAERAHKVSDLMSRIITKELAEKIRWKLCGNEAPKTTGGHDVYAVRYNNTIVGVVSVRRGSEKDKGHDFIPRDLSISPNFAKEIGICNKDYNDYVECLRNKNLLPVSPEEPPKPALERPRPWEQDWVARQEPEGKEPATPKPEPPEGE